jgi:hypothetical protein
MTNGTTDIIRYFRVDRRDLVYLKFILEAYEGMSTLSTVEKSGVIVSLTIPAGFVDDMAQLVGELQRELSLVEVARPACAHEDTTAHA